MAREESFSRVWASSADQIEKPTDRELTTGHEGGADKLPPKASVQNYMQRRADEALQEIERTGALQWYPDVPYAIGAVVRASNNTNYISLRNNNVNNNPALGESSNWKVFGSVSAVEVDLSSIEIFPNARNVQSALAALGTASVLNAGGGNDGVVQFKDLTWGKVSEKPDTATRWPTFGEVTGKPEFLDRASFDGSSFVFRGATGDVLYFGRDNLLVFVNAQGESRLVFRQGRMEAGEVPWARIYEKPDTATRWPTFGEVTVKPDTATRWPTFGEVTVKPDTATRWPTFGEVTGKPEFLDRASFDGSSFVFRGAIGDVLYFGQDNLLVFVNAGGENRLVFRQGRMEAGIVPVDRVEGLGSSARLGVVDTQDPEQIPRDGGGAFATSATTVAGLRDRIRMFGEIGCYALAQNLTGQRLRPGSEVDGGMLMPTACDSVNDDGGRIDKSLRLSGVWRCLGQAEDVGDNDNRYRKTTLFVRIR